ncbi:Calcium-independent phospholipase A2-gamma [Fusarium albosuccineum]|uniref:Calcium-independent phospholipase A2-gamma n=1 Tax=Fusarium albosuccineum TaxID=1237068 RepID=A0A8H4P9N7_9HYPO|nr:Calcium-independent phospholipase A2-gamma [Fusarium albosuccineum]
MATSVSSTSYFQTAEASWSNTTEINPSIPIRGPEHISDEEGPWAEKTVVTFDGGGIRGYSSLLILKKIMLEIRRLELLHEEYPAPSSDYYPWMEGSWHGPVKVDREPERVDEYLPCHYFDYMAGTSTGGLSSIMLGRLRMSVDEALDEYTKFGNAVFGKPRWFHERSVMWYPRAKFSCRKTREAFKMVVYRSLRRERECNIGDVEIEPLKYREDRTRTIAVSWAINKQGGVSRQFLWRSYDNNFTPRTNDSNGWNASNAGPAHTAAIWQGTEANDHTITKLRRAATRDDVRRKQFLKKYSEIGRHWKNWMVDTEGFHGTEGWLAHCRAIGLANGNKHRLNVEGNLHTIPLDDWRPANTADATMDFIRAETETYLQQPNVTAHINSIAQQAVEIRRQRAIYEKWESFAVDVAYYCQICPLTFRKRYDTRAGLRQHLEESSRHRGSNGPNGRQMQDHEVAEALDAGRTTRHRNGTATPSQ